MEWVPYFGILRYVSYCRRGIFLSLLPTCPPRSRNHGEDFPLVLHKPYERNEADSFPIPGPSEHRSDVIGSLAKGLRR